MAADQRIDRFLADNPFVAAAGYVVIVLALIATAWLSVSSLNTRRATVQAAEDMLARLEGRRTQPGLSPTIAQPAAPTGSVFLEGPTVTVAAAALLQRIATAVNKLGGNVLSSQIEMKDATSKERAIGLIASCEIEQARLQDLLYDIEAGMPFLFIDQLVIQGPSGEAGEGSRLRVLMSVSGHWEGT